ncbi:hypothetical protein [Streptomyces fradiae]|uniref:hypothetical protein n=1 Tax=Streptomyces fradiae TaxID=1906 RepID=UPI003985ED44
MSCRSELSEQPGRAQPLEPIEGDCDVIIIDERLAAALSRSPARLATAPSLLGVGQQSRLAPCLAVEVPDGEDRKKKSLFVDYLGADHPLAATAEESSCSASWSGRKTPPLPSLA